MKKRTRKQLRTLLLAIFAAATFAWSAIYIFDVPSRTMLQLFLLCAMLVLLMMMAALVPALLLYYWRHGKDTNEKTKLQDAPPDESPGSTDSKEEKTN